MTKLIEIISKAQKSDGSFPHLSSPHTDFSQAVTYTSPFFTALILDCLCDVTHPELEPIKRKAADFLAQQLSENLSVNYWVRNSREAATHPYPDDLDDTMLTLAALYRYDPALLSTERMVTIINLLTQLETSPGGPYRTWVTDSHDPEWRDVDVAVNANVAYFLSLLKIKNQVLSRYITQAVALEDLTSRYYPTNWPVLFYVSRVATGQSQKTLYSLMQTEPTTTLERALKVLCLINVHAPLAQLEPLIADLAAACLDPAPLCFDPAISQTPYFAGSEAATAAFCLTAQARYATYEQMQRQIRSSRSAEQRVLRVVKSECSAKLYCELIRVHRDYRSHRIVLTTHDFEQALVKKPRFHPHAVDLLGAANLFGWYAYSIFDAIMDDQQCQEELPSALQSLNKCHAIFQRVFADEAGYLDYITHVFDNTHAALQFEIDHLRFDPEAGTLPSLDTPFPYEILAQRSFGHVIGPLGMLYSQAESTADPLFQALETFYCHFLITRQLLDDAHDWEEDLHKGQLNAISYELLNELNMTHITADRRDALHNYFWEHHFPNVCKKMLAHISLAKRSVSKVSNVIDPAYFSRLSDPLEKQIKKSLKSYEQTKELMRLKKLPG